MTSKKTPKQATVVPKADAAPPPAPKKPPATRRRPAATHTDISGYDITVGDYVVYAAKDDEATPLLRYGVVTKLSKRPDLDGDKNRYCISVVGAERKLLPSGVVWRKCKDGRAMLVSRLHSVLVVTAEAVPLDVQQLLSDVVGE